MIEDLKNKGFKEEKENPEREITISFSRDKARIIKNETASFFELKAILETLLRNL